MYVQVHVPSCVFATYFSMGFFFGWVIKLPRWVTTHLLLTRGWVKKIENSRALAFHFIFCTQPSRPPPQNTQLDRFKPEPFSPTENVPQASETLYLTPQTALPLGQPCTVCLERCFIVLNRPLRPPCPCELHRFNRNWPWPLGNPARLYTKFQTPVECATLKSFWYQRSCCKKNSIFV